MSTNKMYELLAIMVAILMAVSNSFKVPFRLIRTMEKAGKIKRSFSYSGLMFKSIIPHQRETIFESELDF